MSHRPGMHPAAGGHINTPQAQRAGHLHPDQGLVRPRITISHLPNELLIKIFSDFGSAEYLLPVMAVCQAWRNVVRGAPEFWCHVYVDRRLEWLSECLERSQPLEVQVTFRSPATDVPQALDVLRLHKDRITSLGFRPLHCAQIAEDRMVLEDLPRLETVQVFVDHTHNHAAGPTECMHEICPALILSSLGLQRLNVHGMMVIPGHPAALSSLRELKIGGCVAARKGPRLALFIGILNACISLEKLALYSGSLDVVRFDLPQNVGPRVTLPRLCELTISGKVEQVSNLLSHMEVRDNVNLWVETDDQEDIDRAAVAPRAILPNDIPACAVDILKSATRILVDVPTGWSQEVAFVTATRGMNRDHKINIVVRVSQERCLAEDGTASLKAQRVYFVNALTYLPAMFPNAPVETIVCRAALDAVDEETWRSLFSRLPMLRTLVISDHFCGDLRPLFRALMSPQSSDDQCPVCRHLEYIWVRNASGTFDRLAEVRKCILWRTARNAPLSRLRLELTALMQAVPPNPAGYRAEFARLVHESDLVIVPGIFNETDETFRGVLEEFPFDS
ncbi:hypothetical protein K466DRAFT_626662 [Polyporus arcularius HHB13444]|uniref:F-box domain-containing protein n=1 Tax=Polyporus arcularius HHB13444 TaxID=1314778 RepID=A0A5C3PS93_9APHY|nr:hypothetical protein K466DRAFT_626662 [Polyporus arcularius HHB13444]